MVEQKLTHSSPSFTVVIPATDERVLRAVRCIARESQNGDVEVVVVMNNCSIDRAEDIKKLLIGQHKETVVKVFYKPSSTIGGARNIGIKNAAGKYVVHIDSDCEICEGYFLRFRCLFRSGLQLIRGTMLYEGGHSVLDEANRQLKTLVYSTRKEVCYTPNLIVSTQLHKNGFMFDETLMHGEDTELTRRFHNSHLFPAHIDDAVIVHRDSPTTVEIVNKYINYGLAREYRFRKWERTRGWKFYLELFGSIPSLKGMRLKHRVGILILYAIRDLGVVYGLLRRTMLG